jgi:hypothetical protein
VEILIASLIGLPLTCWPVGSIPAEREIAKRSYHDYLSYYEAHEGEAQNLLKVGESAVDKTLAGPRLAALTMVTNQVMNLDEVLNK